MNVDDIYLILHRHWVVDTAIFPDDRQRVQITLLILEMVYTAMRPAALVFDTILFMIVLAILDNAFES
jgi:hypothetical protein